jgi:hypothetical protein
MNKLRSTMVFSIPFTKNSRTRHIFFVAQFNGVTCLFLYNPKVDSAWGEFCGGRFCLHSARKVATTSFLKKKGSFRGFLPANTARRGCSEKNWVKLPKFSSFRLRHVNVCLLITDTVLPVHRDWQTRGSRFG